MGRKFLSLVPGLEEKRPDIPWQKFISRDPWPYEDEIAAVLVDGVPKMTEVTLFAKTEKTLIVMDLCFNIKNARSPGAILLFNLFGTYKKFAVSRMVKLLMKDRAAFKNSMEKILAWDFEKVVPAHGEILQSSGNEKLRGALGARGVI